MEVTEHSENVPMPVTVALAVSMSPALPPGLTKDVPISTETPVMY